MKSYGRPVLGAIAGFFFFLFLGLLLLVLGVLKLDSVVLVILPLVGIVFGVIWGRAGPLGSHKPRERAGAPAAEA